MEDILDYFSAERFFAAIILGAGIVSAAVGIYLALKSSKPFYKGVAYGLLAFALIETGAGFAIYTRTPKDIERVSGWFSNDKNELMQTELPRMENVQRNFTFIFRIGLSLLAVALLVFLLSKKGSLWKGVALLVFLNLGLLLLNDLVASQRGAAYLAFLEAQK